MIDNIPTWLAAPLIPTLWAIVMYKCYILPGYLKDRADLSSQKGTL